MLKEVSEMLLDTYAWVEFFQGSEKGEVVKKIVAEQECYTSIISLAEITEWCLKNKLNPEYFVGLIENLSIIVALDKKIAGVAGKINFYHKKQKKIDGWGMVDSFIYATARVYDLYVLTGDKHFKGLLNVNFL